MNGVSLNIYKNQITTIIGHNGAGKSTLIAILSGMLVPTSGKVIVDGYDMAKNPEEGRSSLGICLQTNMYFENLTVKENLKFFMKLRGTSKKNTRNYLRDYSRIFALNMEVSVTIEYVYLLNGVTLLNDFFLNKPIFLNFELCTGEG